MKLDKIKFAMLISHCRNLGAYFMMSDIQYIDDLIDINVEPVPIPHAEVAKVDELLRQLNAPDGFVSAIKAYRALTGAGLKESKEAIERYRNVPKFPKTDEPATLGDILRGPVNFDKFEG